MMTRPTGWLRAGLLAYCGVTALVGVWAAGWPRGFYQDFPWPGHSWVALLPAYNEHLVRDVPHLVFHLNHLEPFGTVDAVAQVVTLTVAAVLPVPLLGLVHRAHAATRQFVQATAQSSTSCP
jgi:hypothetical protein